MVRKFHTDLVERLEEELGRRLVDLANGGPEIVASRDQVTVLLLEKGEPRALLLVFFDREEIHRPDAAQPVDQLFEFRLE